MKYIWIFIFSIWMVDLFADTSTYCFNSMAARDQAARSLKSITVSSDQLWKQDLSPCLKVEHKSHRKQLFDQYLRSRFQLESTYSAGKRGSGQDYVARNVTIIVEGIANEQGSTETWRAGKKSDVSRVETKAKGNSNTKLVLGLGLPGRIRMDDQEVYATVRSRGISYEIEFSMDRESTGISTTVSVKTGEKINLGDIVETIDRKNRELNIAKGITYSKEKKKTERTFFLSIQN